jgi:leucyl-tRNA synthetase
LNEIILHNNCSITKTQWPKFDENLIIENKINLPIQINGKLKHVILVDRNATKDEIIQLVLNEQKITQLINGKYSKIIYIPGKIINIIS